MDTIHTHHTEDLLTRLRALAPTHPTSPAQAFTLAETQAETLLAATHQPVIRLPEELITDQPGIRVEHRNRVTEPRTRWDRRTRTWTITVKAGQPEAQQRAAVLRAFKHVTDATDAHLLYHPTPAIRQAQQHLAGIHFAACVLMNRHSVELILGTGVATTDEIAAIFGVDTDTARRRLAELNLIDHTGRIRLNTDAAPLPITQPEGATP